MNNRIMIKLSASEDCITLRTFTKNYHSPQGFILTQKELSELEEKGYLTVSDIRSFAELALRKSIEQEEILEIVFTWLSDAGGGKVSGMTETVRLPYEKFKEFVVESRENGTQKRMLSLEEESRVKVTFQSGRNLKAVAETKALRKNLGSLWQTISRDGKAAGRSPYMMILNPTAFSFRSRRLMVPACAEESFCMDVRIWKRHTTE